MKGNNMATPAINLGHAVATGRPVTIPLELFERHCWIQGMTGGRKTILATIIILQLMELELQASFVLCDLGGDTYAFNRIREACEKTTRPFQFLSLNREDDWDSLDPMAAITPLSDLSAGVAYLHSVLGGDQGEGYGTGFFGRYSYVSILRILTGFVAEGDLCPTLHDFARRFSKSKGKLSDQSEAQLAAEMMLTYDQVQPSEWGHKRILVPEAIERGQITYGFLPTLMHPGARMLATTLVFSFVLEAMRRHHAGLPIRPIYLVIDEFPAVAGSKQWADLLVLARKYSVRIVCLTQTSEQMKSRDRDLLPVLFDNTAIKIWQTPTSPDDIVALQALSRDELKTRGSTKGFRSGVSSVSMHEVYEPHLERNDILDAGFTGDQGFLILNAFRGHEEPTRFRFSFDVSRDEYQRLVTTPLPKREPPSNGGPGAADLAARDRRRNRLAELLDRKRRQLDWQTI
jgi:hypothetical protein